MDTYEWIYKYTRELSTMIILWITYWVNIQTNSYQYVGTVVMTSGIHWITLQQLPSLIDAAIKMCTIMVVITYTINFGACNIIEYCFFCKKCTRYVHASAGNRIFCQKLQRVQHLSVKHLLFRSWNRIKC